MKDEVLDMAKRIPFQMLSHLNETTRHILMHQNEPLGIRCESVTPYRNGKPGKGKRFFYTNEHGSPEFPTLVELLNAHPDLAAEAMTLYPPAIEEAKV